MNADLQKKISKLQMMEQSFAHVNSQVNSFNNQLNEVENAIHEVEKSEESFQIIGSVLVKKDSKSIIEDLENKKVLYSTKLENLQKGQKDMAEKIKNFQKEVYAEIEQQNQK